MADRDKILLGWTAPFNAVAKGFLLGLKKTPLGRIASVEYYRIPNGNDRKAYYVFYTDEREDNLFAEKQGLSFLKRSPRCLY
jgi:hypothetical protein